MHFKDILNLAARAWNEIKDPNDPEFNQCALTHRENLGAAAQAVVNSGYASTPFEKAVMRIYREDATSDPEIVIQPVAASVAMPAHSEHLQMEAVREEFKGTEDAFVASEPVRLSPMAEAPKGVEIAPHPKPEALQGTITVEKSGGKTSATVNLLSDVATLKGPLPRDFPAHDLLHEAGINTYTQLSKVEDYTSIDGIGPVIAEKIANRLVEDSQTKEN